VAVDCGVRDSAAKGAVMRKIANNRDAGSGALYWHSGLFVMVAQFAFFLLFIAFEKPA
jgi:hypothetical protein